MYTILMRLLVLALISILSPNREGVRWHLKCIGCFMRSQDESLKQLVLVHYFIGPPYVIFEGLTGVQIVIFPIPYFHSGITIQRRCCLIVLSRPVTDLH